MSSGPWPIYHKIVRCVLAFTALAAFSVILFSEEKCSKVGEELTFLKYSVVDSVINPNPMGFNSGFRGLFFPIICLLNKIQCFLFYKLSISFLHLLGSPFR